jgi:predicted RNA-binding Zn-ribbon protein involved in translation (DUF1610 family)
MRDGKGIRLITLDHRVIGVIGGTAPWYIDMQGHIHSSGTTTGANWYPPGYPTAQNAVLVPTEEVPVEKIRCPDCGVEDIALSKDAYKEHTYTTLDCGCRFSEPRLLRALKRHVL